MRKYLEFMKYLNSQKDSFNFSSIKNTINVDIKDNSD